MIAELIPLAGALLASVLVLVVPRWPRTFRGFVARVVASAALLVALSVYGPLVPAFVHPGQGQTPRVFVVGLSRTGTTSLASSLREDFGYRSHHAAGRLLHPTLRVPGPGTHAYNALVPKVDKFWADAFDAHTDIQSSLVFEQLAEMYPDAIFILSRRSVKLWAKAAQAFFSDNAWVWQMSEMLRPLGILAPMDLFRMMYGEFESFTEDDWQRVYVEHEKRVRDYFKREFERTGKQRLHEYDVTKMGFVELKRILGRDTIRLHPIGPDAILPRVYVFRFTFFTQSWWQVLDFVALVKRELNL